MHPATRSHRVSPPPEIAKALRAKQRVSGLRSVVLSPGVAGEAQDSLLQLQT